MSAADNKAKIEAFFATLTTKIREQAPQIVAETATEYYKENIIRGVDVNGFPFTPLSEKYLEHKKRKGDKIMYLNGLLFASIKPSLVSAEKVIVSAGGQKVSYARIHNEGLTVNTVAKVRAFNRNSYKAYGKKGKRRVTGSSPVKAHERRINYTMPRRQFMGHSSELNRRIVERLKGLIKNR